MYIKIGKVNINTITVICNTIICKPIQVLPGVLIKSLRAHFPGPESVSDLAFRCPVCLFSFDLKQFSSSYLLWHRFSRVKASEFVDMMFVFFGHHIRTTVWVPLASSYIFIGFSGLWPYYLVGHYLGYWEFITLALELFRHVPVLFFFFFSISFWYIMMLQVHLVLFLPKSAPSQRHSV